MNQGRNFSAKHSMDVHDVEAMLRAGGPLQIEPASGRVAERVRARLAVLPAAVPHAPGRWVGSGALLAACAMIVAAWLVIGTPAREAVAPAPFVARLTAAIDHSAAKVRAARPEQPMVIEVKRLKAEVERGVGFFKQVIPRVKSHG